MANSKDVFSDLARQITLNEPVEEIESILYLLFDRHFGLSRKDILAGKKIDWDAAAGNVFIRRINSHEPIQYILGETDFYSRSFRVNPTVLIPRPETELLVDEILPLVIGHTAPAILDIGTGSGCLAVTLAKELPLAKVTATDVSPAALTVARQNAIRHHAEIEFILHDILTSEVLGSHPDIIVSNPPYITQEEKGLLKENVLNYEPHTALFAPPTDSLAFYRAIAAYGEKTVPAGGSVVVEINERYGAAVSAIFIDLGFRAAVTKKDLNEKDRIVVATR
jgi:release factor glutamine methyltransferase